MANRIEGVTEKLLDYATQEFLEHGYLNASMRMISEKAGTTPRSIYTRYGDKEGLFAALVDEHAKKLKGLFVEYMDDYSKRTVEDQKTLFHNEAFYIEYRGYMDTIIDYMYDHFTAFKLLVCCSEGTKYAAFLNEIAQIDEEYTLRYIENTDNDVIRSGRAGTHLIHLLCSAYVHGFFEVIRHDMTRDEAGTHIQQLLGFYSQGWDKLFNP